MIATLALQGVGSVITGVEKHAGFGTLHFEFAPALGVVETGNSSELMGWVFENVVMLKAIGELLKGFADGF